MNLEVLKNMLAKNNVSDSIYSLNEGLKPNAYILNKNYSKWEFFFLDEKGQRNNFHEFINEEDAFEFFWGKIELEIRYPLSIPPSSVYGKKKA